jgi:hypothetical protein
VDFTATQLDILFGAWATSRDGNGQVLEDDAIPDAHELAEQGWLERRILGDELAWFWTPAAETALDIGALFERTRASVN